MMKSSEHNKDKNNSELNTAVQKLLKAIKQAKKVKRFSWLKPKISIEQFCGKLYDDCIFFSAYEHAKDMRLIYWGEIFNSIVKIDNNFEHIGLDVFTREMTALQAELFGLAWMHHFRLEQYHGFEEKYTLSEIVFTKNYMVSNDYGDIWNIMSYYNKTVADAILHPCIMAVDRAYSPLVSITDEVPWASSDKKFTIEWRVQSANNWTKTVGSECAVRVVNRASTREDWGGCPIALMLTLTFTERVGWKVNLRDEGFAGFEKLLDRLYNDFKQEIEAALEPEKYLGTAIIQVMNIIIKTENEIKTKNRQ